MVSRSFTALLLLVAVARAITSASPAAPSAAEGASAVVTLPNEAARGLQELVCLLQSGVSLLHLRSGSGGKADASLLQSGSSMDHRWSWPAWVPWASSESSETEAAAGEGGMNKTSSGATLAEGAAEKTSSGQSSSEEAEVEQKGTTFSVTLDSQLLQESQNNSPKPAPVVIESDQKKKQVTPAALATHTVGASTQGASFSVKLDSQLLQQSSAPKGKTVKSVQKLSDAINHTSPAVLASHAAGTGSTSQAGASFSVKLDSELMQHSNSTSAKALSAVSASSLDSSTLGGASKKKQHTGAASFSVKLDSQLLQANKAKNATVATSSPAAFAAEGTRSKKGATFSVTLDSQLLQARKNQTVAREHPAALTAEEGSSGNNHAGASFSLMPDPQF